jgi:poly(A) polymerase
VTRIAPAWLADPATQAVLAALEPAHPLFVGGCVRDALMGIEAADVDLCVAVPPERSMALLDAAGLGAVPTGLAHGTVTAVALGRGFEVTTLRRDVETFGRHARVTFTDEVAEDAGRRDFTVNALYADAQGRVIDPLGGLPDLAAGRVRFVGEPTARIAEDRLRILRFFRFTARLSRTGVDAEGLAACAAGAHGLRALSRERIGHEMRRLLDCADPVAAIEAMDGAGVLTEVAPWADASALAPLVAAERAAGIAPSWARRLGAMGIDGAAEAWRLSRAEARRLDAIGAALAEPLDAAGRAHLHGADAARDAALIEAARGAPLPPELDMALARGVAARFPLVAPDLIAAGIPAGPALGQTLARLRRRWVEASFAPDRDALLAGLAEANGPG